MTFLVKPLVARLATRGLPGPRTSRCWLLGLGIRPAQRAPLLVLARRDDATARAVSPCRRSTPVLPPRFDRGTFPWWTATGTE